MGMKFGTEKWTESSLLRAKFYPHRFNDKGIATPKLKLLLKLYQISEYERPEEAYPLRDFHDICRICILFQIALAVKIWMDLLKRLQSYGVLRREHFSIKASAATVVLYELS